MRSAFSFSSHHLLIRRPGMAAPYFPLTSRIALQVLYVISAIRPGRMRQATVRLRGLWAATAVAPGDFIMAVGTFVRAAPPPLCAHDAASAPGATAAAFSTTSLPAHPLQPVTVRGPPWRSDTPSVGACCVVDAPAAQPEGGAEGDGADAFVVVHCDALLSGTTVGDSFGCMRRAVLGARVSVSAQAYSTFVDGEDWKRNGEGGKRRREEPS